MPTSTKFQNTHNTRKEISNFYKGEYTQQAAYVNFSKIASVVSGSKVTAQKVLSTMMDKNINAWQKVEVIASITALETLYLGGSGNISGVITGIGASYTGSNNVPLIESKGDFGARLNNVAAAPRYIFAKKGENFEKYFNKEDLNVLPRYTFEGEDIEYQFFTYTVPMILVNGTNGLGSGYSSNILPRNVDDIEKYLKYNLTGKNKQNKPFKAKPYFKGFLGTVEEGENDKQWIIKGAFKRLTKTKIEILEVPIGETYKSYIKKLDKLEEANIIKGYIDQCDPKNDLFSFIVSTDTKFSLKSDDEILRVLKLVTRETENYTLNDENNVIKVFDSVNDIFWHYYKVKMFYLQKRKDYLIKKIENDIRFDISKYTFIKMIVENKLKINKRKKSEIVKDIEPVESIIKRDGSYDYLLAMQISSLTVERMNALLKSIKEAKKLLDETKNISLENMWLKDIG